MLINISRVYSFTRKETERKEKKIYLWEEGLRKALCLDEDAGRAVENICAWHVMKRERDENIFSESCYWKDRYEVDMVHTSNGEVIPIEVKYRKNPHDVKGLREYMTKHDCEFGIAVTRDTVENREEASGRILFIPAWLFLLMVG